MQGDPTGLVHTSTVTWSAPAGILVTGPTESRSKLSNSPGEDSSMPSLAIFEVLLEVFAVPRVTVDSPSLWATSDPGCQLLVALASRFFGTVTVWVTEEMTWLALSALAVAVLVTESPSLSGPLSGTRMAMSTSAVAPAVRPTEPSGLGGAGRGEVNAMVSLRVAAS